MASLYDIDQSILACVDAETGEVVDPEALDALLMEKEQKIESLACWVKNLEADAAAFKTEAASFTARQKAAEKKAESLKSYLTKTLAGQKFSTAKCAVSFKASEQVYIPDESIVPKKFLAKTITVKPDKLAIKAAIKAGLIVKGCELVGKQNINIK